MVTGVGFGCMCVYVFAYLCRSQSVCLDVCVFIAVGTCMQVCMCACTLQFLKKRHGDHCGPMLL